MTLATTPPYDGDAPGAVGQRAVVVGGSIAGLIAARVLADAFERVVVVERDPLPSEPVTRRNVPQADHVHVLLEAGQRTLEDLFPGLTADVRDAGGLQVDVGRDLAYYDEGGFVTAPDDPPSLLCASRPLLEAILRRRVAERPSITLRDRHRVTDYRTDDAGRRVTGVAAETHAGEAVALDAELVVDATGRTSRTPDWLDDHGYAPPPVSEVRVDVGYATVTVERPPDDRRGFLVPPSHPRTRGATVVPVENDRWTVTLIGVHGDDPPTDPDEFEAYAADLPVPEVAAVLSDRPWIEAEAHRYPFPASRRRRYEALDRFPDGLVVLGDGVASVNPIYGQGMTVAALQSLHLHHALATGGLDDLAARFFDGVGDLVDTVWRLTVGADFQFPQAEGDRPFGTRLVNPLLSRLIRTAHTDPVVATHLSNVLVLNEPPTTLARPGILRRVFLSR
jgi:2-polyprenyl-6-methoxyphenol hydroxylase-like FAD-dependent oxidoreductase